MKKIVGVLLTLFIYATVSAQTVSLRFDVNNRNSNVQEYAVEIDGTRYYSSNVDVSGTGLRNLAIDNLSIGSHKLVVYKLNTTTSASANTETNIYSNTFRVRNGYDMVIAIKRNGQVTFTEKQMDANSVVGGVTGQTPMTTTAFNTLLTSVKSKWSQSSKASAVTTALNNQAYYFSTDQVGDSDY